MMAAFGPIPSVVQGILELFRQVKEQLKLCKMMAYSPGNMN